MQLSLSTATGDDTVMDMLLRYGADLSVEEAAGHTAYEWANGRKNESASKKIRNYGMFDYISYLFVIFDTITFRNWN
jgi:ankyrin repeat protein